METLTRIKLKREQRVKHLWRPRTKGKREGILGVRRGSQKKVGKNDLTKTASGGDKVQYLGNLYRKSGKKNEKSFRRDLRGTKIKAKEYLEGRGLKACNTGLK